MRVEGGRGHVQQELVKPARMGGGGECDEVLTQHWVPELSAGAAKGDAGGTCMP